MADIPIRVNPCPFCGHHEVDEVTKYTGNYKHGSPVYILFLKCVICGASTKAFPFVCSEEDLEYWNAMDHALDAWNRRLATPQKKVQAHWIVERDGYYLFSSCSACGKEFPHDCEGFIYCPNCGVPMYKEES